MGLLIGIVVAVGSLIGGFLALGGHLVVLWQPFEFVIIFGIALGTFIIAKQTLIAFMNGALPQIALEHGRKTISSGERPTIDEVESEAISNTPAHGAAPVQKAA